MCRSVSEVSADGPRISAAWRRRVRTPRVISMSMVGPMQRLWAEPSGSLYLFSGEQEGPVMRWPA